MDPQYPPQNIPVEPPVAPQQSTEPPTPPPPPVKDTPLHTPGLVKKLIVVIGIILVFAAIGAGGYFLGVNKNKPAEVTTPKITAMPTPTPTSDETANWKTYTNSKFGYHFKYPPEFTIYTGINHQKQEVIPPTSSSQEVFLTDNKVLLLCCEAARSRVEVVSGPIDAKNWKQYAVIPDNRIESQGEITFAGKKAFEVKASAAIDSEGRLILVSGNPFSYVIIQGDEGEPWEKITNSFRFESPSECKITGCSGQICSYEDAITTCEYKAEYACYKKAKCERQANGKCGWTQTVELTSCLSSN